MRHKFVSEESNRNVDGENVHEKWLRGTMLRRGREKYKDVFYIHYDGDDENEIYKFELVEDWENGDLELLRTSVGDLIDSKISHLYVNEETDCQSWYMPHVADVDEEKEELSNPDFLGLFDDDDPDEEQEEEYYMCDLLEDYANGWVRFL